eukprot:SAG22_NODE_94_length_20824_cov_230.693718_3_plen_89_part_00
MCGVLSPLMWGSLYSFFSSTTATPKTAALQALKRIGGRGGHMVLAAAVLVVAYCILKTTRKESLFLEPEERGPARLKRDSEAGGTAGL